MQFTFENTLILIFAATAVGSAVMMITRRSPITSALYLIVNFFSVSVIYLMLKSQFIAIIQILVYAGAIMVLFLSKLAENITYKKLTAVLIGVLLFATLGITAYFGFFGKLKIMNPAAEQMGTVESVGRELYTTYSFPFEVVSFVLIAAIIGAIVLAQRRPGNQ